MSQNYPQFTKDITALGLIQNVNSNNSIYHDSHFDLTIAHLTRSFSILFQSNKQAHFQVLNPYE